jgi:hypothetical protein
MPLLCARRGYHLPFYRHIWALTIHPPPLAVLCDGLMSADISRRSRRSAGHLVNPRSSCSRCEIERLSSSVSVPLRLKPFTRFTEKSEFTVQTCYLWMVWMLRTSVERIDGVLPSS